MSNVDTSGNVLYTPDLMGLDVCRVVCEDETCDPGSPTAELPH